MRKCEACGKHLPPETHHFFDSQNDDYYHIDCVERTPYTAYSYYAINGDYIGDSEFIDEIEEYEDEYEEEKED